MRFSYSQRVRINCIFFKNLLLSEFIMNLAIIILGILAVFFAILSVTRFLFFDHKMTIAIKTWNKIAIIFFVVCAALLFF